MKIPTGVPGLDRMLHGGLIPNRPYIVSGPLGSGKTTMIMQFLLEGIAGGERALIVALDEPPNEIRANMRNFRRDIGDIDVLDANSDIRRFEPTPIVEISDEQEPVRMRDIPERIRKTPEVESHEVTVHSLQPLLKSLLRKRQYARIAIDSMTGLRYFCMREFEEDVSTQSFMRFLTEEKVTALLAVETAGELDVPPESFLSRGEIRLHRVRDDSGIRRFVSIEKYKGSAHEEMIHPMEVTQQGVVIHGLPPPPP
ncbi:MAG TPA: ATPase domain-containing protein [Thermoplasmata archaeon]|nr:ATPase domain-containing protein [Thermoplasmata archaeon]